MKFCKEMTNIELAEVLRAVAAAYQIKDKEKNRFKVIAYNRAADAVEHLSSEAKDLWDDGKLTEIAGIGKSIAEHLDEVFRTGKSKHFEKVFKGLPQGMFELINLPGIGAKSAFKLANKFNISEKTPISDLEKIAKKGEIESLEGFGKDSQTGILESIKRSKKGQKRMLISYATGISSEIIEWMKKSKVVSKVDPLGSLRRKVSTIGDIDIAVSSNSPKKAIEHFVSYPRVKKIVEKGEKTSSVVISGNLQIDLIVANPKAYGALLQHFTGSKHHNIALREYAMKKGLSLSEYGIKQVTSGKKLVTRKFSDEESFYKHLGMDWIPPELREGSGEVQAAQAHKLPNLIELKDVKADFQLHSDFDIETSHDLGETSMEEMVEKASDLGYEYIAFTEHNPSRHRHSEKQVLDLLKRKKDKVDKLNYSKSKKKNVRVKKVFNSLEIDIRPNGKLAIPERGFGFLDFALVSVHSSFRQNKSEATKRVLDALSYPKAKIFAHPTGRKLNEREGLEYEWERIFDFCKKNNKWIEINASPSRLDLPDHLVKEAVKADVKLTLGTDSHHKDAMDNMIYGISVARRGWASKKDIINTRSLKEFEKMIG